MHCIKFELLIVHSIDWAEIPGFVGATGGLIGTKLIVCGGCTAFDFALVSLRLMLSGHICKRGLLTNYVTHFSLFFDHQYTYGNAFAAILLMIYNTRFCYSKAFANHPPTSIALRNL